MFYLPKDIPFILKTEDNTATGIAANKHITYSLKVCS